MGAGLVRCCSIGFHLVPTSLGSGSCAGAAVAIAQDVPQGVLPNLPEVVLEQIRLDRARVELEQLGQPGLASLTAILQSLQQRAANALGRLQALLLECAHPGCAHFVDHLSEIAGDMESIQHAPRLPGPCADHPREELQVCQAPPDSRALRPTTRRSLQHLDLALLADRGSWRQPVSTWYAKVT